MTRDWLGAEQARDVSGLRLVLSMGVPGPWGEAAKGLFHAKGIPFARVAQLPGGDNDALRAWTGRDDAPIAIWNDETPRDGWIDIAMLAERIAPVPRLVPDSVEDRALVFGLGRELCGELGLGWCRRLMLSALDVWWVSFAAMIVPLPPELCPMRPDTRAAYAVRDPGVLAATDPALLAHRDFVYREHLELPVRL